MQRLLPARLLAALRPEATSRLELPSDLVRESRGRVRVAAAIGAAAYALFLIYEVTGVPGGSALEHRIDLTHDALGVGLCAALLVVASLPALSERWVLGVALTVETLLSALISLAIYWASFIRTGHISALTWVVPVIILFPLLVPTPPRLALLVSVMCALTMPAALSVLAFAGQISARASDYGSAWLTGGITVGIATVAARAVYGASRQIAAARTLGSYELTERLSEGGMGEVWKARHLFLARPAAVKMIRPEQLQGPAEERHAVILRFTLEAQVTADLRSPHTVQLFDFGVSADGALYYAMELLKGMNAEHFIYRFGPLEPRRAVHWLRQACHSLGEAHAQHLVHRDIKPANLFVCRYGRDVDVVKVLDFGLTRLTTQRGDMRLTGPGWQMGTPGYMAPEQVYGLETGPQTDLYALGCVAYWLLAGVRPFEAETAGELLRQHAEATPPPLAGKTVQPLPQGLEALIMACLSKDPAQRPRDADAFDAALGNCIDGEPWSPSEAHDWWEKNIKEL